MPTLIQIVDAALASATLRSGPHLVCRPGCTQCCVGVFPIAQQDAARLREGLAALIQTDPDVAPYPSPNDSPAFPQLYAVDQLRATEGQYPVVLCPLSGRKSTPMRTCSAILASIE